MSSRPRCPGCNEEANVLTSQKGQKYFQCINKCIDPNSKKDPKQPFWMGWYTGPDSTSAPSSSSSSSSSSSASSSQYHAPSSSSSSKNFLKQSSTASLPPPEKRSLYTGDPEGPLFSGMATSVFNERILDELVSIKKQLKISNELYRESLELRRKKRKEASVYLLDKTAGDGEAKPRAPPPKKSKTAIMKEEQTTTDDEIEDE